MTQYDLKDELCQGRYQAASMSIQPHGLFFDRSPVGSNACKLNRVNVLHQNVARAPIKWFYRLVKVYQSGSRWVDRGGRSGRHMVALEPPGIEPEPLVPGLFVEGA